jgi:hypothetical protein
MTNKKISFATAKTETSVEMIADPQIRANRRNIAMERNDIEWYVAHDGAMRLRFKPTAVDALFKRIERREISQHQIDRLPEYIKRVAWGQCLLNYDYEGRYYLPKPTIHDYQPGDDEFTGDEPCTAAQAKAIMTRYKVHGLLEG